MIMVMDIGNTNIKSGLYEGNTLKHYWRVATNRQYTSDEYGVTMEDMFHHVKEPKDKVEGIIISSVVPTVNYTIDHMCRDFFDINPIFVQPGIKTGINLKYDNTKELGSDRICNAVAAYTLYGGPCVYIDFGTATTFGVIDKNANFLGGCICPGIKVAAEALVSKTAKLPHYELVKPPKVIGKNTIANLQSGIIFGYVGQIEYLVARMKEELNEPNAKVIATGGVSHLIAAETKAIDHIDNTLTLSGLRLIYEKNN
ncbi:MAG: type III pantothenate kinase [Eubacteriales bacterium]|nr:type III pantothenate kinase [Eubacteriales bacterium]